MFKFEEGKCYKMPAHFGGSYFDPDAKAIYDDVVTLIFSYTTDGEQLSNYVPEGFELTKPELSIEFQQCRQVEWMAGSYYDLVSVAAPVRFNGQRDRLEGSFSLVVWENKTTPILTGNMMGVPKIYADIEDLHILADTYRTRLSFEGSTFLELEMIRHQPLDAEEVRGVKSHEYRHKFIRLALHSESRRAGSRFESTYSFPNAQRAKFSLVRQWESQMDKVNMGSEPYAILHNQCSGRAAHYRHEACHIDSRSGNSYGSAGTCS